MSPVNPDGMLHAPCRNTTVCEVKTTACGNDAQTQSHLANHPCYRTVRSCVQQQKVNRSTAPLHEDQNLLECVYLRHLEPPRFVGLDWGIHTVLWVLVGSLRSYLILSELIKGKRIPRIRNR